MFNCLKKQTRKTKITPHPNQTAAEFTKAISLEIRKSKGITYHATYGFISNIAETGEPGLLLHGTGSEILGFNTRFSFIKPGENTPPYLGIESPVRLHQIVLNVCKIDLKTYAMNKPLHLITCFGNAETSMAQNLANFLKRPVISYGSSEGELIYTRMIDGAGGIRALQGNKGRGNILTRLNGRFIPAAQRLYAPANNSK